MPTVEAQMILQQLSVAEVNLALLETTQIARAVAMLRTHSNRAVAVAADGIVAKWRSVAVAALSRVTS